MQKLQAAVSEYSLSGLNSPCDEATIPMTMIRMPLFAFIKSTCVVIIFRQPFYESKKVGRTRMKRLRVLLLLPGWDARPSQGYPQQYVARTHLYTWFERDNVG